MTTTAYHLSSDLLESYGIESITVDVTVGRMTGESYHVATDVEQVVEIIGMDEHVPTEEKLTEVAMLKGYENIHVFIFEHFEDELHECALEDGPELESISYSNYMARRAESDYR